jgi:hypothetical protein
MYLVVGTDYRLKDVDTAAIDDDLILLTFY